MSTYHRILVLPGEKGLISSKFTGNEWAVPGGLPNRDTECTVGTTNILRRPAAFLKMPKCLPFSMMVSHINTNMSQHRRGIKVWGQINSYPLPSKWTSKAILLVKYRT